MSGKSNSLFLVNKDKKPLSGTHPDLANDDSGYTNKDVKMNTNFGFRKYLSMDLENRQT
jgi:hypothetical protein